MTAMMLAIIQPQRHLVAEKNFEKKNIGHLQIEGDYWCKSCVLNSLVFSYVFELSFALFFIFALLVFNNQIPELVFDILQEFSFNVE